MVFLWSYFLCTPSSQNSRVAQTSGGHLVQHGYRELIAQEALEYLQSRRLYNLCGQPVPVLGHSNSKKKKKKVLPNIQSEPPVFQVVPL